MNVVRQPMTGATKLPTSAASPTPAGAPGLEQRAEAPAHVAPEPFR
jgi:hypothetical protein